MSLESSCKQKCSNLLSDFLIVQGDAYVTCFILVNDNNLSLIPCDIRKYIFFLVEGFDFH